MRLTLNQVNILGNPLTLSILALVPALRRFRKDNVTRTAFNICIKIVLSKFLPVPRRYLLPWGTLQPNRFSLCVSGYFPLADPALDISLASLGWTLFCLVSFTNIQQFFRTLSSSKLSPQ